MVVLSLCFRDGTGFAFPQANIKRGKRFSTAKAYLRPAVRKKLGNLKIVTGKLELNLVISVSYINNQIHAMIQLNTRAQ